MKYPKVRLEFDRGMSRACRSMLNLLQCYPGGFSPTSDIILRWGQNTTLQPGRTTVIFDCGYFKRNLSDGDDRHFRLSINEYHPTRLPPAPSDRWDSLGLELEDLWNREGHILLIGRGGKTRKKQGARNGGWEQQALSRIRRVYPERRVVYRPKKSDEKINGASTDSKSTIRRLCHGASLIYTQWSNVGNEGMLYGIPVVSEGGPMSDVCPSKVREGQEPLPREKRYDYLCRLAYWQWSIREIREGLIWPWLMRQIEDRR